MPDPTFEARLAGQLAAYADGGVRPIDRYAVAEATIAAGARAGRGRWLDRVLAPSGALLTPRVVLVLAVLLGLALALWIVGHRQPGVPFGRIAWVQDGDVWLAHTGGADAVKLMDDRYADFAAVHWLPDGRLAVLRDGGVTIVDVASGQTRDIRGPDLGFGTALLPQWLPDGSAYAYEYGGMNVMPGIRIVDVATGEGRELHLSALERGDSVDFLRWSPDGRWFMGDAGGSLVLIDAATGDMRNVQSVENRDFAWSPDGERIAFSAVSPTGARRIVVMDRAGHRQGDMAVSGPGPGWGTFQNLPDLAPAWSPDGKWIAFRGTPGLTIARPDGSDRRDLSTDPVLSFEWAADSSGLTYVRADSIDATAGELEWIGLEAKSPETLGVTGVGAYDMLGEAESQRSRPLPPPIIAPGQSLAADVPPALATPGPSAPAQPRDTWRGLAVTTPTPAQDGECVDLGIVDFTTQSLHPVAGADCLISWSSAPSPDGSHALITRSADQSGSTGAQILDLATGRRTPLDIRGTDRLDWARWSPMGHWLYYVAGGLATVVSADGTHYVDLPSPPGCQGSACGSYHGAVWTPDESRIIVPTPDGILTGDPSATDLQPMTRPPDFPTTDYPGGYPWEAWSWAPGGGEFAFGRDGGIWMADADGTNARTVLPTTYGGLTLGDWSPDGGRLLVNHLSLGGGREVWLYDPAGGGMRKLADVPPDDPNGVPAGPVGWSPDGRWVAVPFAGHVDLVAGDGSRTIRLDDANSLTWSPDGRFLVLLWSTDGGPTRIDVANADGSGRHEVVEADAGVGDVVWMPAR